jgi:DNA-directed RNA polymerase subunit beta
MDKIVKFNKYSQRKDFSKIDTSFFEEPNLLESIRNSYSEKQLRSDLDEIFKLYFPISHEKNTKYIVHYNGILPFVKHKGYVEESDARKFGLTFSKALYADITLENTETGEIKKITKTKTGVSEGLYFGQIPQMTKNGTFIINGIEKNVVSQIVRAPGLYYLPSSKFKAFAKKDVKNICEIYPGKGSMMNVYLSGHSLLISIASIARTSAQTFTCTEFLKAFGMTEDQIMYIFANDSLILNSLATNTVSSTVKTEKVVDTFTRKNVLLDKQLQLVIKDLNNEKKNNGNLGILAYLKKLLNSYFAIEDKNSKKAIEILDAIVSE